MLDKIPFNGKKTYIVSALVVLYAVSGMLLVCVAISGCNIFQRYERKPAPAVIAVPDKSVPDHLDQGEPAPYPGWLFQSALEL